MADEEQLGVLRLGSEAWNAWRQDGSGSAADLRGANLVQAKLSGTDLFGADLRGADLRGADLSGADLSAADLRSSDLRGASLGWASLGGANGSGAKLDGAVLRGAILCGATLIQTSLSRADLTGANLSEANLVQADLRAANLTKAEFKGAMLFETILADLDLHSCEGLESCTHYGPSLIDHRTLQQSGPLPLAFLHGVGLPDDLIEYLPSLLNQPIQFYSCFISYSSRDQAFAKRLHADLQDKGVRCWFAPHDMPIGAKILDAIDAAIRQRDKVLLVLSEGALASDWVEGEVTRALDEERERKRLILFPIRIDNAVLETTEAWARLLKDQRNIGDFTFWKERDAYQKGLNRLLRDPTTST